jgi:hypothetical protein
VTTPAAPTAGDVTRFAARLAPVIRDEARRNVTLERPALACDGFARYLKLAGEAADAEAVRAERAALGC